MKIKNRQKEKAEKKYITGRKILKIEINLKKMKRKSQTLQKDKRWLIGGLCKLQGEIFSLKVLSQMDVRH